MHRMIAGATALAWALGAPAGALADSSGPSGSATCFSGQSRCLVDAVGLSQTPSPHAAPAAHPASPDAQSTDQKSMQAMIAACRATYSSPSALDTPKSKGGWYYTPCAHMLGVAAAGAGPLTFVPDRTMDPPVLLLAFRAERELRLPAPAMLSSPGPSAGVPKVVNLPTWAWVDHRAWAPVSASASVPGVTVTAVATPYETNWSWGDGSRSTCSGPGTPYAADVSDPGRPSPDCGHTYTATSKSGAGSCDTVTADILWRISWSASTGRSGVFPSMTSSASQDWPVEEIDALAVPGQSA